MGQIDGINGIDGLVPYLDDRLAEGLMEPPLSMCPAPSALQSGATLLSPPVDAPRRTW